MSHSIQAGTCSVEPTGSTAAFSVRNMIFKTVQGRFPIESAEISVDADGVPRSVTATLDAAGFSETGAVVRRRSDPPAATSAVQAGPPTRSRAVGTYGASARLNLRLARRNTGRTAV
jgi:hypothetical protein